MNILFFLTPKSEVAYVDENDSLRQVLEKMEHHGYAAVPLLSSGGKYIGTITEGDVLWKLKKEGFPELHEMEDISVMEMIRNRDNKPVHINVDMEGLMERIMKQNFVPVVDDDKVFIGIVTRKDAIQYLIDELKKRKYDGTAADKLRQWYRPPNNRKQISRQLCCRDSCYRKSYFICSSCFLIILRTISPPIEPASLEVRSPL